jgi:hypothetical protein
MESVRSAQIQVNMWIPNADIYTDRAYWRHARTGQITYDVPTVQFYLPPNFKIPDEPPHVPEGVDINAATSSSEDSLGEWQRKYGQRSRNIIRAPSRNKKFQTVIEEDYHDHIVNTNVLQIEDDKQLQYLADSDGDSVVSRKDNEDEVKQKYLLRRTMRTPANVVSSILPSISAKTNSSNQQMLDSTTVESYQLQPFSAQTNRSQKTRQSILAFTQLNSPFTENDNLLETLQSIEFPPILPSPRPDNIQDAAKQIRAKAQDEYEIAYKAIRRVNCSFRSLVFAKFVSSHRKEIK